MGVGDVFLLAELANDGRDLVIVSVVDAREEVMLNLDSVSPIFHDHRSIKQVKPFMKVKDSLMY